MMTGYSLSIMNISLLFGEQINMLWLLTYAIFANFVLVVSVSWGLWRSVLSVYELVVHVKLSQTWTMSNSGFFVLSDDIVVLLTVSLCIYWM